MQKFLDKLYSVFERIVPKRAAVLFKQFFTIAFFTFLIIGVINTLSTTVISSILDIVVKSFTGFYTHPIFTEFRLTFIIGYILSMIISFFLNCRFTFHEKPTVSKLIKFPVSYIPNFIIQYITVWFFTSVIPIHPTLSYLIAALIGIPVTFATMRVFVFKKKY